MATASQMQSAEPTSSSIGSLTGTPAISTTTNSKISSVPTLTDSGDSSLSTGAVAGIAVSSIIAGVALILVIVLLMRKRHLDQRFEEKDDIVNPKTSRDQQQHHELSAVHVPELPEQPRDPYTSA
jgi:cell wall integrity and stress response component